mmetsp:Transcript_15595/g.48976  ORF Transcript_15595/g.48976 Transcript_15595/m.48976 type:complete len:314 (-) Transcript_15595:170-1111(-)
MLPRSGTLGSSRRSTRATATPAPSSRTRAKAQITTSRPTARCIGRRGGVTWTWCAGFWPQARAPTFATPGTPPHCTTRRRRGARRPPSSCCSRGARTAGCTTASTRAPWTSRTPAGTRRSSGRCACAGTWLPCAPGRRGRGRSRRCGRRSPSRGSTRATAWRSRTSWPRRASFSPPSPSPSLPRTPAPCPPRLRPRPGQLPRRLRARPRRPSPLATMAVTTRAPSRPQTWPSRRRLRPRATRSSMRGSTARRPRTTRSPSASTRPTTSSTPTAPAPTPRSTSGSSRSRTRSSASGCSPTSPRGSAGSAPPTWA